MSRIITKRIIPILLLVMLCIGMFPTAFAEEEIMIADTPAATQIEVVQDSSDADITIVPNEDAGDLIADPYLVIYKLGDDGQPLPGVSFKITNDAGRELGTYTTNSAGRIVLTGIDEGHYVVQEAEAAEGYELDATPYDVYLQWGKTTQIKLKNKELGSLSLVKVSAENEKQVLPGASFLLYDEKGSLIGEYTTDENGEILLDHVLKAGIYTLKEIKARADFQRLRFSAGGGVPLLLTAAFSVASTGAEKPPQHSHDRSRRLFPLFVLPGQ